ncbi:MAG: hypothetical protein P5702_18510 [Limnospira sp. PMC 1291.21]|uniref:Uncharacterized protein n=1 Tax=Limnospira maxima CS-328 TaxID=513049 RepID=B5VY80_LIMMA|nr:MULTISPECIES: hypothetical protein [Limnospira]EKD07726.1 hypothetical protein SPLC1_S371030 [Arthrospira platensis C1]QJB25647.1 hypothetical protein HFV01_07365 [Limnospira fusiformis SAG 85.79]RAQ47753.1 hypothetical protein B9S53_03785 [Arthrospira sp. O9.13F]EDZ95782.1 hypothetical protein AmaxDRAFT_1472 [Limnospira maxima CS-328]MDT9179521.1 hypothetical protein [Limnospira sp. PMC 1238.20]
MMKLTPLKFTLGLSISAIATFGFGSAVQAAPELIAQATINPLQDFDSRNSTTDSSNTLNQRTLFDILHSVQQGRFDMNGEFIQNQQNQNIQDAAAEFRQRQRQAIELQPSLEPTAEVE